MKRKRGEGVKKRKSEGNRKEWEGHTKVEERRKENRRGKEW